MPFKLRVAKTFALLKRSILAIERSTIDDDVVGVVISNHKKVISTARNFSSKFNAHSPPTETLRAKTRIDPP